MRPPQADEKQWVVRTAIQKIMANTHKLIGPFKECLTMAGLPIKGALKDAQMTILQDAGIQELADC